MKPKIFRTIASGSFVLALLLNAGWQAQAQDTKAPYPSAAPESISRDAEVVVLGRHGYETAVKGKNGFVCMVERSWTAGIDDPDFWNPKVRAPICFNPPAARFNVPLTIKKTELVLAARSKAEMAQDIKTAFDKKELPRWNPARCAT